MEQMSEDYTEDLETLREMLVESTTGVTRETNEYALRIQVDELQRFVLPGEKGYGEVYHYVIFRLRNRVGQLEDGTLGYSSHYNEVLAQIAEEYRDVEVDGNALRVISDTDTDDDLNTILDRSELARGNRQVPLTVIALDENLTRMEALDDIHEGHQDRFNFEDQGRRSIALGLDRVRKRIEERLNRRLLLPSEIAQIALEPYDPGREGVEGFVRGEVYGIAIFDSISPESDRITLQFHGISNKTRNIEPVHPRDQVADYFNTRVLRHIYQVTYRRSGDEYARDLDRFERSNAGWVWHNTFQRLTQRRDSAMTTWFLDNIADAQNKPNQAVFEEFQRYYREQQQRYPELPDLKLDN